MSKRIYYLILLAFICRPGLSQKTEERKLRFHSINSVALVNGNNAVSAALQTINGFQKENWFLGAGLGLDYYLYRTIPIFADLRYELGKKKNRVFVYGDAGIHLPWVQDYFYVRPEPWNGNHRNNFSNGLYSDAGIGLAAHNRKGGAFILSLGYSNKILKEYNHYLDWRSSTMQTDVNTYRLKRVMVKMGFRF